MERLGHEGNLILLLEDDQANLLLTRTVLEEAGHRVAAARTVGEARRMIAAERPALVLTDIQLPDASGLEFARELTADPRTAAIPVVCLTAHAMPGTEVEALEAGCADYLTKPIDIAELARRVRANLDSWAAPPRERPGAAGVPGAP